MTISLMSTNVMCRQFYHDMMKSTLPHCTPVCDVTLQEVTLYGLSLLTHSERLVGRLTDK